MKPDMFLAKAGRRWVRRFPADWHRRFVLDHYRKWCPREEVLTLTDQGFSMYVSPFDYVSHRIFFFGNYDPVMTMFVKANVPEGAVCWDVGAERGWFTVLMGHLVGPAGRVDAFEADPPTFQKLVRNVDLNKLSWVRCHNVAVSAAAGRAGFIPSNKVHCDAGFLQGSGGNGYLVEGPQDGAIEVTTIALDAHASETGLTRLDVIKMDIEGAEVAALSGAHETIMRFRPTILVEYHRAALARAGASVEQLDTLLDDYGYDRFTFDGRLRRLVRSQWDEDWAGRADHEAVMNVFCVARRPG